MKTKITLTPKNTLALAFLAFIMQETHEIAHTSVGRIICGCWGRRNFNIWGLCGGCTDENSLSILATYAGPFYTFSLIWIGVYLLSKTSLKLKSIGFALIVANMPFSRILTPIFGGGDIIYALNQSWDNHTIAWIVGLTIVSALTIPPVVTLYQTFDNNRKVIWLLGLLLVPFFIVGIVVFGLLQGLLLNNGVLDEYWVLGSPVLVTLWLIISATIFIIFSPSVVTVLKSEGNREI